MTTSIKTRIGARLRELRSAAGISQAELAERLEPSVEPESISRYERGTRTPSFEPMETLAEALGTDLDGFMAGLLADTALPDDQRELRTVVELLAPLTAEELRAVRELVKAHLAGVEAARGR
jgi:transcriptional regulator with XRE-family HTH domain